MEIFPKINNSHFIKGFIITFYKVLNTPLLWKFVVFVIKPNYIFSNNNPKLQNFFKKSEVVSKRKALSIVVNNSTLDLLEFIDLFLLNYVATTLHQLLQQTGLQEKCATAVGAKDSVNDTKIVKVTSQTQGMMNSRRY